MLRLFAISIALLLASCSNEQSGQPAGEGDQAEQAVELIFNTYLPPHEPMRANSIDDFSRRIEEESGGSIQITIPGSSLTKPDSQLAAVKDRLIDMAMVSIYASRTQLTLPMLGDIPGNAYSGEATSIAMWETQQRYFDDIGQFADVKLLSMHVLPGFSYVGVDEGIQTIDDFSGKKVWISAGEPTDGVRALGAIAVHSEFPALFEYVSKGTVDAAVIGPGTVKQASLGDHVNYLTQFPGGLGSATWAVVMNRDTWNELSADQQAAVMRAAEGLPGRTGRALDARNDAALAEINLEVNQASPELMAELKAKLAPLSQKWIEDARAAGLENAEEAFAFYHARMVELTGESEMQEMGETIVDSVEAAADEAVDTIQAGQ